uniref:hypothetical protein n=1 Tax=Glycomyces salinus TaxID=980294 RepID=UPI0018ED89EA
QALTVLGTAEIGDRLVRYGTLTAAPRLWVAFADTTTPPVFGYLTGLATGGPTLHVTDQRHLAWTRTGDRTDQLIRHGLDVWRDAQRACQG